MTNKQYNPERCEWHEDRMRDANRRIGRIESALFTTNGEPGLIETVRKIATFQKWQAIALFLLFTLQVGEPAKKIFLEILRSSLLK